MTNLNWKWIFKVVSTVAIIFGFGYLLFLYIPIQYTFGLRVPRTFDECLKLGGEVWHETFSARCSYEGHIFEGNINFRIDI